MILKHRLFRLVQSNCRWYQNALRYVRKAVYHQPSDPKVVSTDSHPERIPKPEQTDKKAPRIVTLDSLQLSEDPNCPKSPISCSGCGAKLHCQNRSKEGFVSADEFKEKSKLDLMYTLCYRCQILNSKVKLFNLEASQFDYDRFIVDKLLAQPKAHVILLIDLLDVPNSIYAGWSKLFDPSVADKIDVCILGNKFDLLPKTGHLFEKSVRECLMKHCNDKGISGDQIRFVEFISAKTGYNVEHVITRFFKLWNDEGDVYLLGMANAGKSVLFNLLLSSDYCRSLASEAMIRATTSFWPGTTLNLLKFPIRFLNEANAKKRARRVIKDTEHLGQIEEEREKLYDKTKHLRHAERIGVVGSTFKPFSVVQGEVESDVEATYSRNDQTGLINEGKNYQTVEDIVEQRREEARAIYKPHLLRNKAAWFYDTPGVLGSQEILKYFSQRELNIAFSKGLIMPRVHWLIPGQSLFVGGLMRVDLLESTNNERVLFSIMASHGLPVLSPIKTSEAERTYEEYYEKGDVLRVPHKQHVREKTLPGLDSKTFEIDCVGNFQSTADIVFSCFGWMAVTSRPETKTLVRAFTLGGLGLELRKPSLLPYIVNLRRKWHKKDQTQSFVARPYTKPNIKI